MPIYPVSGDPASPWVPEVFGDAMLVNGKLFPYLDVQPRSTGSGFSMLRTDGFTIWRSRTARNFIRLALTKAFFLNLYFYRAW